jgi:PAS domain S-box-containing protein
MLALYRKMQIGLFAVFATLLVVGAISYRALLEAKDSQQWVRHTSEVREQLVKLGWAIEKTQAASRSYGLSGDDELLREVIASRSRADEARVALLAMTADNPDQQRRLGALAGLAHPITLEAAKTVGNGSLAVALEAYRQVPGDMEQVELQLLAEREAKMGRYFAQARISVALGSILGLAFVVITGWIARRDNATVQRTRIESDERIRVLVDGVQDYAIFMLDPQGTIVSWNIGAERIKGYGADEIIGQNFSRFYAQEDIDRGMPAEELRVAASSGRTEVERWRVRKNGSRFLASLLITAARDASGELVGFSEISRDITERKESEAKYRGLLEAAPDAMVVVSEAGKIVLLNVQAEQQFGYRRDELLGQDVTEIIPTGFAERLKADALRTTEETTTQQIGTGIELSARRKDGSEFPVEVMLSPLESSQGILVTAAIRDITDRKRDQGRLLQTVGELKRSNDELEHFAYVASHDLQEPLRMVASFTELLAKRYKGRLDADADDFIAYAVDGTNRMQRLINDLLAYSRAGASTDPPRRISSEAALRSALTNLQATIVESAAVVTHDSLPLVTMDDTQLTQVFQNLIGNAVKYRGTAAPRIHISAVSTTGTEWVFSVRDNGLGIEPQYFEKIFVLFQRLHGRGEFAGTGIGLAICKKMLERLGGRIWVESEASNGSTFHFAIPEGVSQ